MSFFHGGEYILYIDNHSVEAGSVRLYLTKPKTPCYVISVLQLFKHRQRDTAKAYLYF